MLFRLIQNLIFRLPERALKYFPGFSNYESLHKRNELTIHPNKVTLYSLIIPKFFGGEDYNCAEYLSVELNPTKVILISISKTIVIAIIYIVPNNNIAYMLL